MLTSQRREAALVSQWYCTGFTRIQLKSSQLPGDEGSLPEKASQEDPVPAAPVKARGVRLVDGGEHVVLATVSSLSPHLPAGSTDG